MTGELFVCHASEDKQVVARPLTEKLRAANYNVWYDQDELLVGDDLTEKIARGLSQSRYSIVILSPAFFAKRWTFRELSGIRQLDQVNATRILPVWHGVTLDDVNAHYPWLANRLGVSTDQGMDYVVQQLLEAIHHEATRVSQNVLNQPVIHRRTQELLEAARESNGQIIYVKTFEGVFVTAGTANFSRPNDPRTSALNWYCLCELVQNGLATQSHDIFSLTRKAYAYIPHSQLDSPYRLNLPEVSAGNASLIREILLSAVENDGTIILASASCSCFLSCGARFSQQSSDQLTVKQWEDALGELQSIGLLHMPPRTAHSQCYEVTHLGYLWTDFMRSLSGDSQTDQKG
jgi:hypothetical protein